MWTSIKTNVEIDTSLKKKGHETFNLNDSKKRR